MHVATQTQLKWQTDFWNISAGDNFSGATFSTRYCFLPPGGAREPLITTSLHFCFVVFCSFFIRACVTIIEHPHLHLSKWGGGVAKLTHLPFVVYLIILSSCKRETLVFACSMACTCMYFVSVELGIFVWGKSVCQRDWTHFVFLVGICGNFWFF